MPLFHEPNHELMFLELMAKYIAAQCDANDEAMKFLRRFNKLADKLEPMLDKAVDQLVVQIEKEMEEC